MERAIISGVFFAIVTTLLLVMEAKGDIYVYTDPRGVLHFTNAPTHSGYQPLTREGGKDSRLSSLSGSRFEETIRSASERYGVEPHLVRAVIKVESDFKSQARSRKGAQGLMQLMPETARLHSVNNVYDPNDNIDGGVRHLRFLLDRYQGNLQLSLAAYNAGVKAVEKYRGVPPFPETKEYIRRVLDYLERYRKNGTTPIGDQARRQD